MTGDIGLIFQWWGTLFLIGAIAFPLSKLLFKDWYDHGYLLSKSVGLATVTFLVYFAGTFHLLPFTIPTIVIVMGIVFVTGVILNMVYVKELPETTNAFKVTIILEELFFIAALILWSFIKAHEPSIHGLEKFMDFGFAKSILNSRYFPAPDMWYAGGTINYYYFGHIVMALLSKLSNIDLRYGFNLMLTTIFALTATLSYSIGYQLWWTKDTKVKKKAAVAAGLLTSFLVTLGGNLQTIYAFTQGYSGDQVKPFWQLLWPIGRFWQSLPAGLTRYWYANATRFIPYTIHEFPSYSFVVSDVHGHVLSLPFVLLAIALLITLFSGKLLTNLSGNIVRLIFYGILVGILLMTNALDGPVYFMLFLLLLAVFHFSKVHGFSLRNIKDTSRAIIVVGFCTTLASVPFIIHFKSFVSGLAINCPLPPLANTKFGPFLFEGVEKCQHSPLWMWLLLWGFFIYCGIWFVIKNIKFRGLNSNRNNSLFHRLQSLVLTFTDKEKVLVIFFIFSVILVIFPEFFYFKDIYPMHFRSNTMFKLGYQAFILFSIVSAYTVVSLATEPLSETLRKFSLFHIQFSLGKTLFFIFLIPLLFLVSIYPIFSVRSYFNSLVDYQGLDGLAWLAQPYPDDYAAIEWLNKKAISDKSISDKHTSRLSAPVLVEADGDSYTDYARFSAFTGIPTIIGWPVHEWLWRGSYDVVAPRREDVRLIYESTDLRVTQKLLSDFHVRYIVVGSLEKQKYQHLAEWKFSRLGTKVFSSGNTTIYEVI